MRKLLRTDWPTPLTEVLERGLVPGAESVGQVVDYLAGRGDAIGVGPDGRLAIQGAALARLEGEHDERERIAAEEAAELAELAADRAAELEKRREAEQAERGRHRAFQERVGRLEKAMGVPFLTIETEMRRSLTNQPGTGWTYDQLQAVADRLFSIDEVEQWVTTTYGPSKLEKEKS